jgi:hypothetical protein
MARADDDGARVDLLGEVVQATCRRVRRDDLSLDFGFAGEPV